MSKSPQPTTAEFVSGNILAERYNFHPKVVQRLGKSGFFPRVRIGKRCLRYPLMECDAIMNANREPLTQA